MMHFGRTGKQNNRSQHDLVGTVAATAPTPTSPPALPDAGPVTARAGAPASASSVAGGANTPLSASPSAPFSSNESFDSSSAIPGQQPPPSHAHAHSQSQSQSQTQSPHPVNTYTGAPGDGNPSGVSHLHHSNTVTAAFNPRHRDPDFADQVARSQSHRFSQISPIQDHLQQQQQQQQLQKQQQQLQKQQQQQQQYGLASSSADNLHDHAGLASPILPLQGQQPIAPPQYQSQAPPPKKQSTRKLIKNILSGSSNRGPDPNQHISQNSYNNTAGLARRPSKRVSQPPPIRTGASQVSLEQPPSVDWKSPGPPSRISPLQGVGEFPEPYVGNESNPDLRLQSPHENLQLGSTIRPVPVELDPPTYGGRDLDYLRQQQGHIQLQGQQAPPDLQQPQPHPYNQVVFDPSNRQSQPQPQPQQHQHQQQQQYQFANPQQAQYQSGSLPLIGVHLGTNPHQNPETVSQQSHESPVADPDQPTSATNTQPTQSSPSVNYTPLQSETPTSAHASAQSPQQLNMPPPSGQQPRRSQEADKPPPGPPPSYRHSQQPPMNTLPPPPPHGAAGAQQTAYRQGSGQDRAQFEGQSIDQGRHSPQPPTSDRGESDEKAFKDLLSKYKNVKRLYFDGKKEIEQFHSQIEHLQNALANQRMSQSRTSLDDSEYTTRFNRLNGAINNLSFNIRKDWVTLPSWLVPYVSSDALKTGKQEMTAIGRAVITRWVVEEIFHRCFHPGLDPELSCHLKQIEQNIRHFSHAINSQEEYDALTNKVVNWRMATLEGLTEVLRSPDSADHKADFTRRVTSNLTASLYQHLSDPPPPGVDGSASMIVELAVAIASNLPLESRDVAIIYPLPEQPIQSEIMEVEKSGLPPLESRPSDASEEGAGEDAGKEGNSKDRRGDKARPTAPPTLVVKEPGKVRFAGFVGVEVRGRQVLVKAPVWTLA